MQIRPAELGDLADAVALHDELVPYLVFTATDLRLRLSAPRRPGSGTFAAFSDAGELVGWASAGVIPGSDPLDGEFRLMVHPDHRGPGIGSGLLAAVHDDLRSAGATSARVFADPASVELGRAVGLCADPAGPLRARSIRRRRLRFPAHRTGWSWCR